MTTPTERPFHPAERQPGWEVIADRGGGIYLIRTKRNHGSRGLDVGRVYAVPLKEIGEPQWVDGILKFGYWTSYVGSQELLDRLEGVIQFESMFTPEEGDPDDRQERAAGAEDGADPGSPGDDAGGREEGGSPERAPARPSGRPRRQRNAAPAAGDARGPRYRA